MKAGAHPAFSSLFSPGPQLWHSDTHSQDRFFPSLLNLSGNTHRDTLELCFQSDSKSGYVDNEDQPPHLLILREGAGPCWICLRMFRGISWSSFPEDPCIVSRRAATNYHKLGGLNNRRLSPHAFLGSLFFWGIIIQLPFNESCRANET